MNPARERLVTSIVTRRLNDESSAYISAALNVPERHILSLENEIEKALSLARRAHITLPESLCAMTDLSMETINLFRQWQESPQWAEAKGPKKKIPAANRNMSVSFASSLRSALKKNPSSLEELCNEVGRGPERVYWFAKTYGIKIPYDKMAPYPIWPKVDAMLAMGASFKEIGKSVHRS